MSFEKIIISNNVIEVYTYEHLFINTDEFVIKLGKEKKEANEEDKKENYGRTQKRRREVLRRLICTNFNRKNSKFLTLTFKDEIRDVKAANKEFKKFVQRINYFVKKKDENFKLEYVAVVEFQDLNRGGVVHYHIICNLPYIPKKYIADTWGNGFIKINRIDHVDNLGAYVTKYMNKDIDDTRLMGLKAYNCSKELKRPIEFTNWKDNNTLEKIKSLYDLDNKKPVYFGEYTGDEIGQVTYKQYNLDRL